MRRDDPSTVTHRSCRSAARLGGFISIRDGKPGGKWSSHDEVLQATPLQLRDWQLTDPTLQKVRELASSQKWDAGQGRATFFYCGGLIYRRWSPTLGDWDEYLPYLLFAYREAPQESTGFSPFELLYGRRVRGPLDVLREVWAEEESEKTTEVTHLIQMRERLEEMACLVKANLQKAQRRQKRAYDEKVTVQSLEVGDEVLVLPIRQNKLQLQWSGPYKITKKVTPIDYEVRRPGRRRERKVYHINLLKKWHHDDSSTSQHLAQRTLTATAMMSWRKNIYWRRALNRSYQGEQPLTSPQTKHWK